MARGSLNQDQLYTQVAAEFGAALVRLANGYERDSGHRADLLQEIHVEVWRSLALFDERCSLRTWVYRVAHNVGASHILRQRRRSGESLGLEELEAMAAPDNPEKDISDRHIMGQLVDLINGLKMPDRQIMLLYLEGIDASTIGEIVGINAGAVATKTHRIKAVLKTHFSSGGLNHE